MPPLRGSMSKPFYPWLTPWATIRRASGAGDIENRSGANESPFVWVIRLSFFRSHGVATDSSPRHEPWEQTE